MTDRQKWQTQKHWDVETDFLNQWTRKWWLWSDREAIWRNRWAKTTYVGMLRNCGFYKDNRQHRWLTSNPFNNEEIIPKAEGWTSIGLNSTAMAKIWWRTERQVEWLVELVKWLNDWLNIWMTGWIAEWLVEWLIEYLHDTLNDWLNICMTRWMTGWISKWLVEWLVEWLVKWLNNWPTEWLNDWITGWMTEWLV